MVIVCFSGRRRRVICNLDMRLFLANADIEQGKLEMLPPMASIPSTEGLKGEEI